jgi:predicted DsbA family dithiol-disulfide isomerase
LTPVIVDVWSDIHCPWALIAVHRLRSARDRHRLDVVLAPRAWPLEWVNGRGTPRAIVTTETAALAGHEPEVFNAYENDSWPSTFLPAFELVAAARRRHGLRAAEEVDYALRLAFFRDSVDVSIRAGLEEALAQAAAADPEVDVEAVLDEWLRGNPRADVQADFDESRTRPIQGSPQIFWPDGTTSHNPGMTDHRWSGELVRIGRTQPEEPERLLLLHTGPSHSEGKPAVPPAGGAGRTGVG